MNELDIIRNHFLGYHNNFFDNFKTVSTYPPYNIRGNEEKGVIEMALAGFTKDDLNVEVKENTLSIHGCKDKMTTEDYNIHKGISDRSFSKKFQLHKHIVVDNAELKDGLLKVSYHRDIPEAEKPKTIKSLRKELTAKMKSRILNGS